jgi:hypothetical protein
MEIQALALSMLRCNWRLKSNGLAFPRLPIVAFFHHAVRPVCAIQIWIMETSSLDGILLRYDVFGRARRSVDVLWNELWPSQIPIREVIEIQFF